MNRLTLSAVAVCCSLAAMAEGYQVNTLSARQEGMGGVGVAMKLGAESQLFNPGALAFSDKTFELSGALTLISAHASATHDGVKYRTDNDLSTPLNIAASFKIADGLQAGLMLYTPYGSGINWGTHWAGAALNQQVTIRQFTLQPTVSYRLLPNLSVGAGLMIAWGSVNLDKGLIMGSSMNSLLKVLMPQQYESVKYPDMSAPASVNLKGNSGIAVGYNIGAQWDITPRWTVGASFRSKVKMTVEKGTAAVSYTGVAEQLLSPVLDNLNSTNFKASLPCPYVFTAGVSYKPADNVIVEFDAQLNGWKTYKELSIEFVNLSEFDQHIAKNYHNAMTYHAGVQWGATKRLDLRAGLAVDTSPCDKLLYNPETPAQTRISPSVGLSFRPISNLSVDFAFTYVQGTGMKDAVGHYEDFAYKIAASTNPALPGMLGLTPVREFKADYGVHAFIPGIGLSYSF